MLAWVRRAIIDVGRTGRSRPSVGAKACEGMQAVLAHASIGARMRNAVIVRLLTVLANEIDFAAIASVVGNSVFTNASILTRIRIALVDVHCAIATAVASSAVAGVV